MKNTIQAIGCAALVLSCTENGDSPPSRLESEDAVGKITVFVQTSQAFGLPTPNLSAENIWLAKWIRRPTSAPIHFRVSGRSQNECQLANRDAADGTVVTLQKPVFPIVSPYIPLPGNVLISPAGTPVFYTTDVRVT